jgi:voltage-gated potassium channel
MFLRSINILTLLASLLLLASLSVEIIYSRELAHLSSAYSWAMFTVCIIFLVDLIALSVSNDHPWRYLLHNIHVLILSIPYHTLLPLLGVNLNHTGQMVLSGVVVLRGVMALFITLRWLIERRTTRLFWAYITTVLVCTYFAALMFYEFEAPVNSAVAGFGDAMWWAWMNLATVGSTITPVTALGKIICVVLPILGMAMLPVFTVYITSLYDIASKR